MTPEQTARHIRLRVHEAGHAVHSCLENLPFESVWAGVPGERGWTLGYVRRDEEQSAYLDCLDDKMIVARQSLAGFAAEELWSGVPPVRSRVRKSGDWSNAVWCARCLLTGDRRLYVPEEALHHPEYVGLLVVQWKWTQRMLREHWGAVMAVADLLRSGESLDYPTVCRTVTDRTKWAGGARPAR